MPTYSYRREDGTRFDVFQRITDDALTEDPETGLPVVRVISGGAGLQFKGTGFYLTDYVKKSGTPDPTSSSSSGGSESKSTDKSASATSSDKSSSAAALGSGSAAPATPSKPSTT